MPRKTDKIESGNFVIEEESYCEHCGNLEPYSLVWNSGLEWCITCALNSPEFDSDEHLLPEMQQLEKQKKIEYYTRKIKQLSK